MSKDVLSIDVETYCDLDIADVGAYKYCEHPSFEVMLFAYAFNDEPVQIVDLANGEDIPFKVLCALDDMKVTKSAFNANFERNALRHRFTIGSNKLPVCNSDPSQWDCTMIRALRLGLPGSLDMVGKALHLPEDKQKLKIGKDLIKFFCKPFKPKKEIDKNQGSFFGKIETFRHMPKDYPEKWEQFKEYCKQDVESERFIRNKLSKYSVTNKEKELWNLDQEINDRGVKLDKTLALKAIECNELFTNRMMEEAKKLTGLNNPNSPAQLKKWIGDKVGYEITSLNKDAIPGLIKTAETNGFPEVKQMLEIRQMLGKTSIKKYQTMIAAECEDGRMRGLLQFYGANRTGRWAGRLVQVQNLPQNHIEDLDLARSVLRNGNYEELEFLYENVPDTLSQLIRTAFIPSEGNRFIVADFSAIEARVIAYIAEEQWRLDVFKQGGDIYCASASKMFKVPVEKHGVNGHLRQKGKIAELALGYGGAGGAIRAFDKNCSIPDEELPKLVSDWREASPHIVNLWWDVDKAAKKAIRYRTSVKLHHGISFIYDTGVLFIELPSGRRLSYIRPKIEKGRFEGSTIITYEGMEQTSKQWTRLETYGPKLVENIVQAFARDCLAETMFNVKKAGFNIVMHVHDELILDVPKGVSSVDEVCKLFSLPIEWAPGIPLTAAGYECDYYQKD